MAVYSVPAARPVTLTLRVTDPATGEGAGLTGNPSVDVTDGTGVSVHTGTASPGSGTGVYTYTVPGSVLDAEQLDAYTVTWTGTLAAGPYVDTDVIEVAGGPGRYFTVADLRGFDRAMADTVKYTPDAIERARVYAEQRLDACAEVAFVPRARRARVDLRTRGYRTAGEVRSLRLPDAEVREVYAVTVTTDSGATVTEYEAAQYVLDEALGGLLLVDSDAWQGEYADVWYSHGLDYPPEPVRRAAMMLAVDQLAPSSLSPRATSLATDMGNFRLSTADRSGSTGIPEVDAVCAAFGRQRPHVG